MENKTQQMDVIDVSKQKTEEGKQELYLYSLRKMAEDNVEHNRNPLTRLQNLRSFSTWAEKSYGSIPGNSMR